MEAVCPMCGAFGIHQGMAFWGDKKKAEGNKHGRKGDYLFCLNCNRPWLYVAPPKAGDADYEPAITSNYEEGGLYGVQPTGTPDSNPE